jgi:hypothetical protein
LAEDWDARSANENDIQEYFDNTVKADNGNILIVDDVTTAAKLTPLLSSRSSAGKRKYMKRRKNDLMHIVPP